MPQIAACRVDWMPAEDAASTKKSFFRSFRYFLSCNFSAIMHFLEGLHNIENTNTYSVGYTIATI